MNVEARNKGRNIFIMRQVKEKKDNTIFREIQNELTYLITNNYHKKKKTL